MKVVPLPFVETPVSSFCSAHHLLTCGADEPGFTRSRNRRWPCTANPYLFISQTTGRGVEPVSYVWINDMLGIPTSRLREDRLLHEVEATGGDPRRICDLFGLSVGAVLRYTGTIDQPGLIEHSLRNAGPAPRPGPE